MNFSKEKYLSIPELIELLKSRGLRIKNDEKAEHLLSNIGYFRLKEYLYVLYENPQKKIYKTGSTFSEAFQIYYLDKSLRNLLLREIELIEIALRAQLCDAMSSKHGVFWYADYNSYLNVDSFLEIQSLTRTYLKRNSKGRNNHKFSTRKTGSNRNNSRIARKTNEISIKTKDHNIKNQMIPCWEALDVVTFSYLTKIYANLSDVEVKKLIADDFETPYKTLQAWFRALNNTRNICAHHSRFWNHAVSYPMKWKVNFLTEKGWISNVGSKGNTSTYLIICITQYLLDRINPKNTFKQKLITIIERYTIKYKPPPCQSIF